MKLIKVTKNLLTAIKRQQQPSLSYTNNFEKLEYKRKGKKSYQSY